MKRYKKNYLEFQSKIKHIRSKIVLIKVIKATKLITKIELVSIQLLYFIILIVAIGAAANLLLTYVIIVNNAKILIYVKVVLITVRVQIMAKAA